MKSDSTISPDTMQFLEELANNNQREWFHANKSRYLAAKQEFEQFVAELLDELTMIDPDLQGLKPRECIFRIYRDVRFSRNKVPYKSNLGAAMGKNGRKSPFPNYYIHIEPGSSFLGGGIYHPSSDVLKAVRQEIDYNLEGFEQLLSDERFKATFGELKGDQLKTKPKGYEYDNAALKYLKFKDFIVMHKIRDEQVLEKDLKTYVVEKFKVMKNFMEFLKMPIFDIM